MAQVHPSGTKHMAEVDGRGSSAPPAAPPADFVHLPVASPHLFWHKQRLWECVGISGVTEIPQISGISYVSHPLFAPALHSRSLPFLRDLGPL